MFRRLHLWWLLTIAACLAPSPARAAGTAYRFPEQDLEITVPSDWKKLPPFEGAFGYFTDPTEKRTVVLTASELAKGVPLDPAEFVLGVRKSAAAIKSNILEEGQLTIGPIHFQTFKAGQGADTQPNVYMCTTFVNESAISISMRGLEVDPSTDPEFEAILQSFRFLSVPKPVAVLAPGSPAGSSIRLLPIFGGLVVAAGAVTTLVVFLVRRYRAQPAPLQERTQKF